MAGPGLVDIRSLTRPPNIDGSDTGWKEWVFAFESHAGLLELNELMEGAVGRISPRVSYAHAAAWDDNLRGQSKLLYHILVQLMRGKAASVARSAERETH